MQTWRTLPLKDSAVDYQAGMVLRVGLGESRSHPALLNLVKGSIVGQLESNEETREKTIPVVLRTGEDAWAYFKFMGERASVQFVCFNPVTKLWKNPYELEVVNRDEVSDCYAFMSHSAVVWVTQGEGEVIPLDDWMAERRIFAIMLKIPFFAQYKSRKVLNLWKRYTRASKFSRLRRVGCQSSWQGNPIFVTSWKNVVSEVEDFCSQTLESTASCLCHCVSALMQEKLEDGVREFVEDLLFTWEGIQSRCVHILETAKVEAEHSIVTKTDFEWPPVRRTNIPWSKYKANLLK